MVHTLTNDCCSKAKTLIAEGSGDSLRYATLQLRMAIEYLFYELVPLYKQELPDDILSTRWQPKQIIDAILECDPDAELPSRVAFGPSEQVGEPGWADTVFSTKPPTRKLLKDHYHKLGFYLHAPIDLVQPDNAKWRSALERALTVLSEYTVDQALFNIGVFIHIECACCERTIYRNKRGVEASGTMKCPNPDCGAIYNVTFDGELTHSSLQQESFDCQVCGTTNYVPRSAIKEGTEIRCVDCGQQVLVTRSFRLQPFGEPTSETHILDTVLSDRLAKIGDSIIEKLNALKRTDVVTRTIEGIFGRMVQSGISLRNLLGGSEHDWHCDGASILRTIYDGSLQALYILFDPLKAEELGTRYVDFGMVEKIVMIKLFDKQATDLSRRMSKSAKRATAEPALLVEYERVNKKYGYDRMKKPPKNWYKGSLANVAETVGYLAEYELLQKQLSAIVHSSYSGLRDKQGYTGPQVMLLYWHFSFRVLGRMAEVAGIELTKGEQELVENARRNVFDK